MYADLYSGHKEETGVKTDFKIASKIMAQGRNGKRSHYLTWRMENAGRNFTLGEKCLKRDPDTMNLRCLGDVQMTVPPR